MRNVLKVLLRIIAIILFPITAGLYFIWSSRIFKDRMSQNWKRFWWIIYAVLAFIGVASKIFACLVFILMANEDGDPWVSRNNVPAPDYKTSEDFYKLTGVEFPELGMVDSLFHDDIYIYYREYQFVAKEGLSDVFYKRLERACVTDSTHWEQMVGDQTGYHYEIYPDQVPVDRSRGMCDRMVKGFDGKMVPDWDGYYITVDVVNDTIILRNIASL